MPAKKAEKKAEKKSEKKPDGYHVRPGSHQLREFLEKEFVNAGFSSIPEYLRDLARREMLRRK